MSKDLQAERLEAIQRAAALAMDMARAGVSPSIDDEYPDPALVRWLRGYILSGTERGSIATELCWLPDPWGIKARMALCGDRPYQSIGATIRLKNTSPASLRVLSNVETYMDNPQSVSSAGVMITVGGKRERTIETFVELAPDAVVELEAVRAIHAMTGLSMAGHPPTIWGESAAIPKRNALVEVGYRVALIVGEDGQPVDSESRRRRKAS